MHILIIGGRDSAVSLERVRRKEAVTFELKCEVVQGEERDPVLRLQ